MKRIPWCLIALLAATAACSDDGDPSSEAPTYWKDVAPIYYKNCVTCHQEGGVAPFALDSYQEARTWAAASAAATRDRIMPPWLVAEDGSCGSFKDRHWLSDEDIATIARWAEGDALEGKPRDDLSTPDLPGLDDGTSYSTPSFVPEIVGGDLARFDEYRCFLIDPGLTSPRFITGYDVIPGNPALVHHVLVMPVDPQKVVDPESGATNLDVMQALDNQSPDRVGWPCFSGGGEGVDVEGVPVVWAPGTGVVEYPAGTGIALTPGHMLVAQIHYNLADPAVRGQSDATSVVLRYQDEVVRPGFFILPDGFLGTLFSGEPATLAPGQASVEYTWEQGFDAELAQFGLPYVEIHGISPHMHGLGHKYRFEVVHGDGSTQCGASVDNWDFGWQHFYFYDQPIRLGMGDRIRVTCDFDTRSVTEPVLPGWGTQNEMCLASLYLVTP